MIPTIGSNVQYVTQNPKYGYSTTEEQLPANVTIQPMTTSQSMPKA